MLVNCDGVTPLARMLPIDWFLLRPDFRFSWTLRCSPPPATGSRTRTTPWW